MPIGIITRGAGLGRYLKEAFFLRWNVLLFAGGLAAALLSPWPDAVLPLVAATELAYLAGLVSRPRFREAIDARVHQEGRGEAAAGRATTMPFATLQQLLGTVTPDGRRRFDALRARCLEMQRIAQGIGGAGGHDTGAQALDRLLWVFLRLLVSQDALDRFLRSTTDAEITSQLEHLRQELEKARQGGDERIVRSLQDSLAVTELRLDNYKKAEGNARFVGFELDRFEGKIRALTEMSVNRQDPDFLTSQVDAVADTMQQTERTIAELQHLTGLAQELDQAPPILEIDLETPKVRER
jgi:hypothetical protein